MADARGEKRKRERRGKTGRIALGGLRRRWRENAALILGVLLAVFFLSTALFGLFAMYASGTEYNEKLYGRADLAIWNVEGKDCAALVSDGVLEEYVVEEVLFAVLGDLQNATDNFTIARYTPELDDMSRGAHTGEGGRNCHRAQRADEAVGGFCAGRAHHADAELL